MSVRINGLDTHYMYRDVVEIVMEQAGQHLDTILVPKVGVPADLYTVETMVSQIEEAKGDRTIGLEALIETALGMANVEAIAATPGGLRRCISAWPIMPPPARAHRGDRRAQPRLSRRSVAFRAQRG
jgi:citrate lyase beta subunit